MWRRSLTLVGEWGGDEGQRQGNELEDCCNNPGRGTSLGPSG